MHITIYEFLLVVIVILILLHACIHSIFKIVVIIEVKKHLSNSTNYCLFLILVLRVVVFVSRFRFFSVSFDSVVLSAASVAVAVDKYRD